MPDLHDELERLAARAERETSFGELRAGRERRDRRRGRRALVVGLCVALVGTLFAFSVVRSKGPAPLPSTAAGFTPPAVPYLWPENWARPGDDSPLDIQDKVDAGAKSLQWRTDPEQVAVQFARNILGWNETDLPPDVRPVSYGPDVPGKVFALRHCPQISTCPISMTSQQQYVWVRQPVRAGDGGVWDVAGAWADTLDTGIGHQLTSTVDTLSAGGSLHMNLSVPPDQTVIVGFAGSNGCSSFGGASQQGAAPSLGDGSYTLPLPDPVPAGGAEVACGHLGAAYAFAYTVPKLTTPTGDPFLESAAITAVTAMPFVLDLNAQSSSTAPVTHDPIDHVTIACDATSISIVGSDTVIAQPDGVHVRLDNGSTEQLSIGFERSGGGDGGDPGVTDLLIKSPPGQETATCQTMSHAVGSVSFTIVDPNGVYVTTQAECHATPSKTGPAWEPSAEQLAADPTLGDATQYLHHVVGTGQVLLTGYPAFPDQRTYALLQDGAAVGWVTYFPDGGGWVWNSYAACTGDGTMVSGTS